MQIQIDRNSVPSYAVAVLATLVMVLLHSGLGHTLRGDMPMLLLTVPIFISAYAGGLGPGLLATALGTAAGIYLFEPRHALWVTDPPDQVRMTVFLLVGVLISVLTERLRSARSREQTHLTRINIAEQQFRLFADAVQDHAIFMLDPQGRVATWAAGAERIIGYTADRVLGRHFSCFVTPEDRTAGKPEAELAIAQAEGAYAGEGWRVRADGSRFWASISVTALRDPAGKVQGFATLTRDLTESKQAAEALADSERRLQTIFSSVGVGIIEVEGADEVSAVNDRACQILKRTRDELLAMNIHELTWPQDRASSDAMNADLHAGRFDRMQYEKRYLRGDDSPIWVHVTVSAVRDENGNWVRSIGTVEDISERKQAEAALRESEAKFRAFFEQAAIGMGRVRFSDARWNDVNPAFCRMLGYSVAEMRVTPWPEITHPDDLDLDLIPFRRMAAGDLDNYTVEKRFIHKHGHYVWARLTLSLVRTADGRPDYEIAVIEDISQRKQAEERLARSEERYRLVNRATHDVIWDWDLTNDELYWNDSITEAFGYRVEEMEPTVEGWYSRIYPDDRRRIVDGIHAAINGGQETWTDEYRFRCRDGTYADVLDRGFIARDETGRGHRMIGSMIDLTHRKKLESALRESEAQFRQLAESMPQLVWMTRPDGYHEYFNRRWYEYTGTTLAETRGELWSRLLHPDDYQRTLERWHHSLRTGEPYDVEYRFRRARDGAYRWFIGRALPVRDEQGGITRWFGTCTEIHEQKETQAELERSRRQLAEARSIAEQARAAAEEASAAKDRFLAVLSHELRTPLTPVLASVSMLQKNSLLDDRTHHGLEVIRRNVELEARLIDDLLDLTRIARGKVELRRQPVDLCTVVQRAIDVCRPDLDARELRLDVDFGQDAPYNVNVDVARLQQVFWNLLKNSIKFTGHGGSVAVRLRQDDDQVVVEVIDTGAGIEPDALPRIFDAFAQANRAVTRQFGGLGLGLAISRSLVELHGGTIEARSEGKNKGTTLSVRLPLLVAQEAVVPLDTAPATTVPSAPQHHPLRILVVEDHGDTAEMMRLMLEAEGHEVQTAGDVAGGLEAARQNSFDVLISDLGLPDGSGLDLMRQLRSRGYRGLGIALSGYGQENDIRQSKEAGFSNHIIKPVDLDQLIEAMSGAAGRV